MKRYMAIAVLLPLFAAASFAQQPEENRQKTAADAVNANTGIARLADSIRLYSYGKVHKRYLQDMIPDLASLAKSIKTAADDKDTQALDGLAVKLDNFAQKASGEAFSQKGLAPNAELIVRAFYGALFNCQIVLAAETDDEKNTQTAANRCNDLLNVITGDLSNKKIKKDDAQDLQELAGLLLCAW